MRIIWLVQVRPCYTCATSVECVHARVASLDSDLRIGHACALHQEMRCWHCAKPQACRRIIHAAREGSEVPRRLGVHKGDGCALRSVQLSCRLANAATDTLNCERRRSPCVSRRAVRH